MTRRHIILLSCFLTIAILNSLFLIILPNIASAQGEDYENLCNITDQKKAIKMQIPIPRVTQEIPEGSGNHYIKNMACYLAGIYRYFAGVAGILATVMIMYGGIKYVISLGNPQKISEAKDIIVSALLGLALTLGSYTILYFINPNLTSLKVPGLDTIPTIEQGFEPDWEGVTFCRNGNKITKAGCGMIWKKGKEDECVGVGLYYAPAGSICAGGIYQGKPTVVMLDKMKLNYNNENIEFLGDKNVDCGAIYYEEIPILPDRRGIGTKCPDDEGCIIFSDDGYYLYQPGDGVMRRGIDNEIGSFEQYECY